MKIKRYDEYIILERHYKDLSDREKEDFDNSDFIEDEDEGGNFEMIYYQRSRGGYDRIWWDKRRKLKRKQTPEEYYSTHGFEY